MFGNDPQCRAPNSGRRKVWSIEGIKQPLQPDHRTSKSHSWTNGKTPRDHKNDPGMQIEILLHRISKKNQTTGNAT